LSHRSKSDFVSNRLDLVNCQTSEGRTDHHQKGGTIIATGSKVSGSKELCRSSGQEQTTDSGQVLRDTANRRQMDRQLQEIWKEHIHPWEHHTRTRLQDCRKSQGENCKSVSRRYLQRQQLRTFHGVAGIV